MNESPQSQLIRGVAFDHAHHQHDLNRSMTVPLTAGERIANHRRMIGVLINELYRPDWSLGRNAANLREIYRNAIACHRESINILLRPPTQ